MPSEKQIEAVRYYLMTKLGLYNHEAISHAKAILTAAEQAEPAPSARSGAVRVRKLEWVDTGQRGFLETSYFAISGSLQHTCSPWEKDDGPFPEHYAISFRERELQPWVLRYWVGNNGLSGLVDSFSTPEEAKAAAQADYERRILAALEPAEPAADAEPLVWEATTPVYKPYITESKYQKLSPAAKKWYRPYSHPSESRYRKALEEIANLKTVRDRPDDYNRGFADGRWQAVKIARAALAQGADDERA